MVCTVLYVQCVQCVQCVVHTVYSVHFRVVLYLSAALLPCTSGARLFYTEVVATITLCNVQCVQCVMLRTVCNAVYSVTLKYRTIFYRETTI